MYFLSHNLRKQESLKADQLLEGDLAVILEREYEDEVVLRAHGALVSLTVPRHIWPDISKAIKCDLKVRKLQKGETVTLTTV